MAIASYLNADHSFNRGAIMRAAHAEARTDVVRATRQGRALSYKKVLCNALALVWSDAQAALFCAKRDAEMAVLPASHAAILTERTAVLMIDSTSRMVAELAAIDARAAALGVAL